MKRPTSMKGITTIVSVITLLIALPLSAQKDPEALKILSDFSKKAQAAPSVSIDFNIVTNDAKEGSITTLEGSVVMTGDKYKVSMPDNSIWCDGNSVWNYLTDVSEVNITAADPDDDSFLSRPSLLFTMYNEGYKIRMLEQTSAEWTIDLYPEDIRTNIIRIRLRIGKAAYSLISAEYKTKDGITVTLNSTRYSLTFKPDASFYTFNPSSYKNLEIIDMR